MHSALQLIYPSQCISCRELVEDDNALCGKCWAETRFISGLVCDKCGTPLPGQDHDEAVLCDDCLTTARPWSRGRAAMLYQDNGRKLVLGLKHGDRLDLAKRTRSLDGLGREARFQMLADSIAVNAKRRHRLIGRSILLVDDVMTSGATLAACTEACLKAGAAEVCIVTLARVAKDV
ncbi:MAG: amidophosphoribosyltransferase [Rhodobacterales bacterium]|nr:MAG: amidophosphoribosyltransferase [Rhodobacterales bacterium]